VAVKRPAGQFVQPAAPKTSLNVPGAQLLHAVAPASEDVPGAQSAHDD
jgi:hypothetical protein